VKIHKDPQIHLLIRQILMPIVLENETTLGESLCLHYIVEDFDIPHLLYAIPSAEGWGMKLK
jgi:hypothetical protein